MKIKQNKFIDLKHKNNTNYALVVLVCIIRGTYQITYNYLKKKVFIEVAQRLLKGFTITIITIKYENIIFILQMHSTYLLSNHNINKSLSGHCFLASDPFIHRFYQNLSIKASEAQKQRPYELLWMLWFDGQKYM